MSSRPPEELIARHEAFLACAPTDRPLIGFWLGGDYPVLQFPHGISRWKEGQSLKPGDVRLEPFKEDYEKLYRINREVDDDFFYIGSAYWGIPWLEAILGCPVVAGQSTCWAEPCLESLPALPSVAPDLDHNEWFQCLLRFTRELIDLSAGRFPVSAPLLRGPGDGVSAMRGAMNMVMEYVDDPEGIKRLLEHCATVRLEVVRRLNAIIPPWHGTHAVGGYPMRLWSKKTVAYHQDDCAAVLSPEIFREFLLPLHRKLVGVAEVNFIHLHSACLWPVDMLLEDNTYQVLEMNIDHEGTGPPLDKLIPVFNRIQAHRKPLLLWGSIGPEGLRKLRDELSPVGLSIQPTYRGQLS